MKKLKVAIIGTGGIAHCHANGYKKLFESCDIIACCDINYDKAKNFAKEYDIPQENVFDNCYDMLNIVKEIDCVSVTTWNSAHKECTIAALNAGKHVIVEKPMALNTKEAEEMLNASQKVGKILQVGFVRRFGGDANAVIDFQEQGLLGDIYYAKAIYLRRDGCPGGWFKDKRFSGGGPLIDLGVHVIDLCRYLAGNPKPTSVFGFTYNNLGPNRAKGSAKAWSLTDKEEHPFNVEDFAGALIKFDNGLTIQTEASFNLNLKEDFINLQLFGTKAGVQVSGQMELYTTWADQHVNIKPAGNPHFDFTASFNDEIKGFIDAVNGLAPCKATGEDGLELMKIIDAIYLSAQTGKSIDL